MLNPWLLALSPRHLRLADEGGGDRLGRATAMVYNLARWERDALLNWPPRLVARALNPSKT